MLDVIEFVKNLHPTVFIGYFIIGAVIGHIKYSDTKTEFDTLIVMSIIFGLFWLPYYLTLIIWHFICVPVGKVIFYCGEGVLHLLAAILGGLGD